MITSVILQNFQSHAKTTYTLCEGVNAIIGKSDSGKTAILRAINWVVTNKPSGESFQSSWGGETIVKLVLKEGITITRGRSSTDNYYMIDDVEYRAFGQDVPLEVKKVLNFGYVNIEKQMDAPFLLGSNSGEVAKVLNKIVDLQSIDTAISVIRKEKMKVDGELRTEQSNYTSSCENLREYDYLEAMEKDVSIAERNTEQLKDKRQQTQQIKSLCKDISSYKELINQVDKTLCMEEDVRQTEEKYEQLKDKRQQTQQIKSLCKDISSYKELINQVDKTLCMEEDVRQTEEKYEQLKVDYRKMKTIGDLLDQQSLLKEKMEAQQSILIQEDQVNTCSLFTISIKEHHGTMKILTALLEEVQIMDKQIMDKRTLISSIEKKFKELMPNTCPLCGVEK